MDCIIIQKDNSFLRHLDIVLEHIFNLLESYCCFWIEKYLWSKRKLKWIVDGLDRSLDFDTSYFQHLVCPLVEVELGLCSTVGWNPLGDALCSIGHIVLCRGEAVPCLVHGEADLTLGREKLWVVLHHALQSGSGLEDGSSVVAVLWIHKFRDDPSSLCQVFVISRKVENESVCVSREVRISQFVLDIAVFVPFLLEQSI